MQRQHRAEAAEKANTLWNVARDVQASHPYILAKHIKPEGIRQLKQSLVLPLRADGAIVNLQFIGEDGKKFLTGGQVRGACLVLGRIKDAEEALLCEGWATGCSLREATGKPVVVAFNAGNLPVIAERLSKAFPRMALRVCGDSDHSQTGQKAAQKAASLHGMASCCCPSFTDQQREQHQQAGRGEPSDYNDLHQLAGLDAVRADVDAAIVADLPEGDGNSGNISGATTDNNAEFTGTSKISGNGGNSGNISAQPNQDGASSRPRLFPEGENADGNNGNKASRGNSKHLTRKEAIAHYERHPHEAVAEHDRIAFGRLFVVRDSHSRGAYKMRGVWMHGIKQGNGDTPATLTDALICSPLRIAAISANEHGHEFGRLLQVMDSLGKWKTWCMPMHMLKGSGEELRGELLSLGAEPSLRDRIPLLEYIMHAQPDRTILAASKTGWHGNSYVFPDITIGPDDVAYQAENITEAATLFTQRGTLDGWRDTVAGLAVGNPLLMFCLSSAFASALLRPLGKSGGGFHLVGASSTGKSTATYAAASAHGEPEKGKQVKLWRATGNGLESVAAAFNDSLLTLDEIGEIGDPRELGGIIYMLANGSGKQRATRYGGGRAPHAWRLLFLSNGEVGKVSLMDEGGKTVQAGQEVRMVEIPANRKHGAFDTLHGAADGREFADRLMSACQQHYGVAGRAFIQHLIAHSPINHGAMLAEIVSGFPGLEGQEGRVWERFAIVAMGGELASRYGITGWPAGAAIAAAQTLFAEWQSGRPKGNAEIPTVLQRITDFVERHGSSRFSDKRQAGDEQHERTVINRAGWFDDDGSGRRWLFVSAGIKEALSGLDLKRSLDILEDQGWLVGRNKNVRFGNAQAKVYEIRTDIEKSEVTKVTTVTTSTGAASGCYLPENAAVTAVTGSGNASGFVTDVTSPRISGNTLQPAPALDVTDVTNVTAQNSDTGSVTPVAEGGDEWEAEI